MPNACYKDFTLGYDQHKRDLDKEDLMVNLPISLPLTILAVCTAKKK